MSQLPISAHLSEVFLKLPKGVDPIVAVFLVLSLEDGAREAASPAEENGSLDQGQVPSGRWGSSEEVFRKPLHAHAARREEVVIWQVTIPPRERFISCEILLDPILRPADLLLDLCVGIGAFAFEFTGNEFYGFDIDPIAIQILKKMGFKFMVEMDALSFVDRARYNIPANRLYGGRWKPAVQSTGPQKTAAHQKSRFRRRWDPRIKNRDSGIAFMRAYFLVKPRAVAILHPMSYLVKPTIYDRLVNFGFGSKTA